MSGRRFSVSHSIVAGRANKKRNINCGWIGLFRRILFHWYILTRRALFLLSQNQLPRFEQPAALSVTRGARAVSIVLQVLGLVSSEPGICAFINVFPKPPLKNPWNIWFAIDSKFGRGEKKNLKKRLGYVCCPRCPLQVLAGLVAERSIVALQGCGVS